MKKYFLYLLLPSLLTSCSDAQTYTVTLAGYNYTDRPIGWYSVDETGGGNIFIGFRNGGGKWACCAQITVDKQVRIRWRLHTTRAQYNAGLKVEDHELTVMVPKPEGSDTPKYMEVHFYSKTHIELRLVPFPGRGRWPEGTDMPALE
jgi:hypothetical protein